jgi:C1q domain
VQKNKKMKKTISKNPFITVVQLVLLFLFIVVNTMAQQPVIKNPNLPAVQPAIQQKNIAFKANATYVGGTPIANNTESKVFFSGVMFDEGKNFSTSTSEFIAPSDGIYHFDLRVSWLQFSNEGMITLLIRTNLYQSVAATSVQLSSKTQSVFDSNFSTILKLKAGDKVSVYLVQQSGTQQKYQQVQLCGFKVD